MLETHPERSPVNRLMWWFSIAVLFALTVPRMTQTGMFGDGLLYAVIARNMGIGAGSFWSPTFTPTLAAEWFEHPPLALGLEAVAFRLLGDQWYVERLYSLLTFATTAFLIAAVWRRVQAPGLAWLPLLFWILPSIVTWAVVNNMLENTQTVFTTTAVLLLLVAATSPRPGVAWACSAVAGLASACAVLSKGPVGLFPLAVPALCLLLPNRPRATRIVLMTAAMVAMVAACTAVVLWHDAARHSLTEYVHGQLFASVQGQRETNPDPLAVLKHLGLGIVARMCIVAGLCWVAGRSSLGGMVRQRPFWFFGAVALSASLPIGISPKMVGHYFLPSVPFFALAAASFTLPSVTVIVSRLRARAQRIVLGTTCVLAIAAIVVPVLHGSVEPRDVSMVTSLEVIGPTVPRDATIGTCSQDAATWGLHAYVSRFFLVALDSTGASHQWFLVLDGHCAPPPACVAAAASDRLALFSCRMQ